MTYSIDQSRLQNKLLANLQPNLFALLAPHLELVSLAKGDVIETLHSPITNVYFPGQGVISVVSCTTSGIQIEVGMIGSEGMTGLPLIYGAESAPHNTLVQIPCRAMRIAASNLRQILAINLTLHHHLLRYAYAFSIQMAQTSLCNGRFTIEQRLARWLLMSHDRIDREDIMLTQEFLSAMLGVRRSGVTTALKSLVNLGSIGINRGTIVIRDRAVLLVSAGEAYGAPEAAYAAVMAAPFSDIAA